ncbi:hypothetical protein [Peribacillus sp. SCS-155]|uniref:hypothetical protein n=1 Tax=Peribacillus sedimenti TaxID=3115297 RepID=UPI003905C20C
MIHYIMPIFMILFFLSLLTINRIKQIIERKRGYMDWILGVDVPCTKSVKFLVNDNSVTICGHQEVIDIGRPIQYGVIREIGWGRTRCYGLFVNKSGEEISRFTHTFTDIPNGEFQIEIVGNFSSARGRLYFGRNTA